MTTKNWFLASFVTLWFVDIALTLMFVKHYGVEMEANPLMRYVLITGGAATFVAVKSALLVPLVPLHKHIRTWIYAGLALVMVPVIVANAHVVFWPN